MNCTIGEVAPFRNVLQAIHETQVERVIHLASLLHPASDENPPHAIQACIVTSLRGSGHRVVLRAAPLLVVRTRRILFTLVHWVIFPIDSPPACN